MKKAIAYYRVSTERQGRSGLGLEAQQAAVKQFCEKEGFILLEEIEEIRSTRKKRPKLIEALGKCRKHKATLMVMRLDRIARDMPLMVHILESKAEFIIVDCPTITRFMLYMFTAVAEESRRLTSENTKAALAMAKRNGVQLGIYGKVLAQKNKKEADAFAEQVKPTLESIYADGITTQYGIAQALNQRRVPTFRGMGQWHPNSVKNVMSRIALLT